MSGALQPQLVLCRQPQELLLLAKHDIIITQEPLYLAAKGLTVEINKQVLRSKEGCKHFACSMHPILCINTKLLQYISKGSLYCAPCNILIDMEKRTRSASASPQAIRPFNLFRCTARHTQNKYSGQ